MPPRATTVVAAVLLACACRGTSGAQDVRPTTEPAAFILVDRAAWSDDASLPGGLREPFAERGPVLLGHVKAHAGFDGLKEFTRRADPDFELVADGLPPVRLRAGTGGVTRAGEVPWYVVLHPVPGTAPVADGVPYVLRAENEVTGWRWMLTDGLRVVR